MIYLDAAVTMPTSADLQERLVCTLRTTWGNVSGAHHVARAAKNLLEQSREICAQRLGVSPDNIVFTSGSTEALNIAIQGFGRAHPDARIFYSAIEHPAVSKPAEYFGMRDHEVTALSVDSNGIIDTNELEQVQPGDLVCMMPVNNELGVINDVRTLSNIVHERGGLVLLDAVQAFYSFHPQEICELSDYAAFSGHKLGGPPGVGMLFIRDRSSIDPLTFGGSQEWELRPGSTPAFLVDGFAYILEQALDARDDVITHMNLCQTTCIDAIDQKMPDVNIHAFDVPRSPHIVALDVKGVESQMLVAMLDARGVCVSRGSACASGAATPSPVLLALGLEESQATSTIRLSFYHGTTLEEIGEAVDIIAECVDQLRAQQKVGAS